MTAKQKHLKLKNLAKQAKANLFEMLRLADDLLSDHDYVDEFGGEDKLMEALADDEFSHFGGDPPLSQMLAAYRANPDVAVWESCKFNVWAMIDLIRGEPADDESPAPRKNWRQLAKDLERDNARLRAELDQLRQENAELRGEVRALSRQFESARK